MSKSQKDSINDMKSDQDSLSNKQLLNKKKKRDSNISSEMNEQNSVHNNEIRCSICLGEEKLVPNCYKCITCSSYFHLDCYNFFSFKETKEEKITKENIDKFECYRCKEEKKIGMEIKCSACKMHEGIIKKLEEDKYLHHYCYVFFQDNLNNLKGGVCKFCSHKKISVLKCHEEKCKVKCHIQCAIDNNIIFWLPYMREEEKINEKKFNNKITFLCDVHNRPLMDNFNEYSATMLISKNDKNEQLNESENKSNTPQENNNDNQNNNNNEINIQKNIEDNNPIKKKKKKEESDKNINKNNNEKNNEEKEKEKELNKENKMIIEKEEKLPIKEKIINTVINVDIVNEIAKINSNVINEKEEKDKNNLNENINSNKSKEDKESKEIKENLESSPKTPVKIDLSKNNKISKSGSSNNLKALNSSNNKDIINVTISKEKEKNIDDEFNISINVDIVNNEKKGEDDDDYDEDEDLEYKPPEIKYEDIDLFENFKNRNEKYILPAAFNKFHY